MSEQPIRLILVRHGNTFEAGQTPTQVGARTDLPLTEQGRNQALYFARYLESEKIKPQAIYAGALKRQIETAEITAKHLHCENLLQLREPALTEIDYGPWEGLTSEEIARHWAEEYKAWTAHTQWPDFFGGSEEGHLSAIKTWLETLRKRYAAGETVVGVTSNGVIRFFYAFQDAEWKKVQGAGKMEDIKVKTGHFCELLLYKDALKVKSWNRDPKALCNV